MNAWVARTTGSRLRLLAGLTVYAAILHFAYQVRVAPLFGYLGSRYRDPSLINYAFAFFLVCVLGLLMPIRLKRPSDFIVWLLFIMTAIPSILVPQYADIIDPGESLKLACVVAASFAAVTVLAARGPKSFVPLVRFPPGMIWIVVAVITVASYAYIFATAGFSLKYADLSNVRDIRFEFRDVITENGALLGYLVRLQGNVINPILVARGIYTRRWYLVVASSIGQAVIFSITGYKLTLLSTVALIGVALLFRRESPRGSLVVAGIVVTSAVSVAIDIARDTSIFTELFVDRLLLVPGTLTAAHVLVFQGQEQALWGYSFMAPFVHYPYRTTPAFMVGEQFIGSAVTSANANYFADGYANLGYPGIFIEGLVLVILLWVLNSAARGLPNSVAGLIVFVPTLGLVNSSVFTSLLTGGFVAVIVALACLPRQGWGRREPLSEPETRVEGLPVSSPPASVKETSSPLLPVAPIHPAQ